MKKINQDLEKRIGSLRRGYSEYPREKELIYGVIRLLYTVPRSLTPNSDLRLAEDQIDNYEEGKADGYGVDNELVKKLREIVDNVRNKYREKDVVKIK